MRTAGTYMQVLLLALVLLAAGCSEPDADSAPPATSRVLDCANQIDILDEPPADWRTVLDVIALPQSRVLQRGSLDEETGRRFSKFGLVIRADEQFTITVVEGARPNALIGWNNGTTNDPVHSIAVPGCSGLCETDWQPDCPLGESGAWVAYPGGVWTEQPTCLAIEIAAGDRVVTTELPIGTECT
jgi:hypothetical protein